MEGSMKLGPGRDHPLPATPPSHRTHPSTASPSCHQPLHPPGRLGRTTYPPCPCRGRRAGTGRGRSRRRRSCPQTRATRRAGGRRRPVPARLTCPRPAGHQAAGFACKAAQKQPVLEWRSDAAACARPQSLISSLHPRVRNSPHLVQTRKRPAPPAHQPADEQVLCQFVRHRAAAPGGQGRRIGHYGDRGRQAEAVVLLDDAAQSGGRAGAGDARSASLAAAGTCAQAEACRNRGRLKRRRAAAASRGRWLQGTQRAGPYQREKSSSRGLS